MSNQEPSTVFTVLIQHKTTQSRRGQVVGVLNVIRYLVLGAAGAYWLARLTQMLSGQ
jgi:hypothetical protein